MQKISRRNFLGASALVLCIPSAAFSNERQAEIKLRFAALSDVHFDRSHTETSPERVRLASALRFMNQYCAGQEYDKFDALVVAGDFSNHGVIEEIGPFRKTLDECLDPTTKRVLCMGNHEYYGGSRELWEKTFETSANARQEINGFQFITVSPEKGTCNEHDYDYLREWLETEIQAAIAVDPSKPVFVVQHYHVFRTVFGSYDLPGDFHAGVKDFADILAKYPQVVHISGHSHYPSVEPRSAWQGGFTAFGTGSLSYFALPLYERERNFQLPANVNHRLAGTFLVFEVYEDSTIHVRLYDLVSNAFLDREYLVVDPLNVEKYVYTDRRYDAATAPQWADGADVNVLELAPRGAALAFSQAQDDACLISYRIRLEKRVGDGWEEVKNDYVWSDFFMRERLEKLEFDLRGLEPATEYRVGIFGCGAFQKETTEPITTTFRTLDGPEADHDAPAPAADLLDVRFSAEQGVLLTPPVSERRAGKCVSNPPSIIPGEGGAPAIASFNGVDQSCLVPFSPFMPDVTAVSLGVRFRLDLPRQPKKDTIAIFGSTESGGLGFEYYPTRASLLARVWLDNKYETLEVKYDPAELPKEAFTTAFLVWDGKTFLFYLDGREVGRKETTGKFRFTESNDAKAFCVGGDVCPGFQTRWFFPGEIESAGVYSWALSPRQVENLSNR